MGLNKKNTAQNPNRLKCSKPDFSTKQCKTTPTPDFSIDFFRLREAKALPEAWFLSGNVRLRVQAWPYQWVYGIEITGEYEL